MKANAVLSHMSLSLVLYNTMVFGIVQLMEVGGGYLWLLMALGGAFMLGIQVMWVVLECRQVVATTLDSNRLRLPVK